MAALAVEKDQSPTALDLKGAISSAVAIFLATIETGGAVPPQEPRREPVPDSSFSIANAIVAVPGIDRMDPHPEGRSMYLSIVQVTTGRTTDIFFPILTGTSDPRWTDNRLRLHETENRDPYRLSKRCAPGTHNTEAEYNRYSDAEDPCPRTDEDREEHRWRYRANCEERHGRYGDAGGGFTLPMMTHPVRKTLAGGATGHAAIGAKTGAGTTRPTRKTTTPSRMRSVVARADTAGLLRGVTNDGPR